VFRGIHKSQNGTIIASVISGQLTTTKSRRLIEICQEETRAEVTKTEIAKVNLPAEATLDPGAQAAEAAVAAAVEA
jgi:hypothetical protein